MGGRGEANIRRTVRTIPCNIEVRIDPPPIEYAGEHVTLDNPPGGRKRLTSSSNPPPGTDPHEIESARWLSDKGIGFKWFTRYSGRKSPDIFIGDKSVEIKTLLPPNGRFSVLSLEDKVVEAVSQSRRVLLDASNTDLSQSIAQDVMFRIIPQFGMLLDEFVILVGSEIGRVAIGWYRA